MSRICSVTGKRPHTGRRIHRKGQSKKSGGIGTHVTKTVKRTFRPNLQRVRIVLPSGEVKRVWVSAKALKAGKVTKA
ncbi:MAG: 50S ribosomal protein L28 [Verrucomicrobiota bacterium]